MPVSMYDNSVPVMTRLMKNLQNVIGKAEAFQEMKKLEPDVLLNARLAPDMFAFKKQIFVVTEMAKMGCARLAGVEAQAPKWEENEKSLADCRARLQKCIDYIGSLKREQIEGSESRKVVLTIRGAQKTLEGHQYLMTHCYPHFFFHVVTSYDILRHNGVEVGKGDYLGTF